MFLKNPTDDNQNNIRYTNDNLNDYRSIFIIEVSLH